MRGSCDSGMRARAFGRGDDGIVNHGDVAIERVRYGRTRGRHQIAGWGFFEKNTDFSWEAMRLIRGIAIGRLS